jgi:hypothetical protein
MSIEVMRQALEALEDPWKSGPDGVASAITALRAAIEQAEKQGPCIAVSNGKITIDARNGNLSIGAPRQWVGLTDEEIMETVGQITNYRGEYEVAVGHAIEAKLREKNNVL